GGDELRVRFDLETHALERGEEIDFYWLYNRDLFDRWRMEQMARHYVRVLEAVAADASQAVGRVELLVAEERRQILEEWNETAREMPEATLGELFEEQGQRRPGETAGGYEGQALRYRELNDRANRLAHLMIGEGVGPEDVVGLAVPRSLEMIVALLGTLKAGAAYLPIDTDYPAERIAFMLRDAAPALLLSVGDVARRLPESPRRLILDELETALELAEGPSHNPEDIERTKTLNRHNLAYIIYTSGSTGTPKGVEVTHASINSLICEFQRRAPLSQGSRCSLWTSNSFDVSVYEMFSALLTGSAIHIPSEGLRMDPDAFLKWLITEWIQSAYIPPFILPALAQGKSSLRRLLVGVEPISEVLLQAVARVNPELYIINGYGPTETTVCSTLYSFPQRGQTVLS